MCGRLLSFAIHKILLVFIDVIVIILLVLATFKGFKQGLLLGVFSFVAIIIGLAAAVKLSAVVANHLNQSVNVSSSWLPILSFALVFIVVVLLVRWGAKLIEAAFEVAMLGWLNRIGGIVFFAAIYLIVFSVLLFYATQVNLVQQHVAEKSVTYPYVSWLGPKAIDVFGKLIPWFKDMFIQLQNFFEGVSGHIEETPV